MADPDDQWRCHHILLWLYRVQARQEDEREQAATDAANNMALNAGAFAEAVGLMLRGMLRNQERWVPWGAASSGPPSPLGSKLGADTFDDLFHNLNNYTAMGLPPWPGVHEIQKLEQNHAA